MDSNDTIANAKVKIEDKEDVPVKQIWDNIEKESALDLVLRLRGGKNINYNIFNSVFDNY